MRMQVIVRQVPSFNSLIDILHQPRALAHTPISKYDSEYMFQCKQILSP